MSRWGLQLVIGKLMTDEGFRARFRNDRRACLVALRRQGVELSRTETAALLRVAPEVWTQLATRIDQRLGPDHKHESAKASLHSLTLRQQQVLRGLLQGLSNKQIAAVLDVSEGAIKATLQQLFRKTAVHSRVQLLRIALDESLDGHDAAFRSGLAR